MTPVLDRNDIEQFRAIVTTHLGLHYEDEKLDYLTDVMRHRMQSVGRARFNSCSAYLAHLNASAKGSSEWQALAEQLTVNETFFFRNSDNFLALAEIVLPERIRAQAQTKQLRILSAGCSSGDEPYSLAIMVREALPNIGDWDVKIIGIDINPAILVKAKQARYSEWSLRATSEDVKKRYFVADGADYVLAPEIQKMVSFEERSTQIEQRMIPSSTILKAKLLIVDDQAANVLLLERLLRSAGYTEVASTQNPTEVTELHRLNKYDLILLDLNMPVMDGFQVMEELKSIETEGTLPVLVITAQPNEKLRALKFGALDFLSKPFDIAEVLARVQNLLLVRLLNLETQKLYQQILVEQDLSEMLLHNMLPQAIAERLKGRSKLTANHLNQAIVDSYPNVTVLFADIVGFTAFSEMVSPEVMVDVLNDLFTRFNHIAEHRGLEKIKTIGDSYMAAAGLPVLVPDHADRAAQMSLDMLLAIEDFNASTQHPLNIRIGISSGAAVAGIIGKSKFLYDLWGDVVNTASRMESHGMTGRIQISDATRQALTQPFSIEHRGVIEVKGKGVMNTWFLNKSDKIANCP